MNSTRRYPSPFTVGDQFTFENKHGKVVLEAVSQPVPVSAIRIKDAPPECLISFDEIEQIALITDQVRLQPVCSWKSEQDKAAWVRHSSTSEAGWVKVVSLSYTNQTPARDQIDQDMRGGRNRVCF